MESLNTNTITQKHYPPIEIDNREPDIIILWQNGEPIQIEREFLAEIFNTTSPK